MDPAPPADPPRERDRFGRAKWGCLDCGMDEKHYNDQHQRMWHGAAVGEGALQGAPGVGAGAQGQVAAHGAQGQVAAHGAQGQVAAHGAQGGRGLAALGGAGAQIGRGVGAHGGAAAQGGMGIGGQGGAGHGRGDPAV